MQDGRPLDFTSKQLSERHLGQSTYEKEMLAILHAVNLRHPYLLGQCFQIKIDHRSLKYFLEQRIPSPEQQKWVTKLFGYDYEIIYRKGKENVVVDALSRKYEEEESLFSLSFIVANWLQVVRQEWLQDPNLSSLIQKLQQDPQAEWWYNTSYHIATHMNPFEAVYRQKPSSVLSDMPGVSKVQEVDNNITVRTTILRTLKEKLVMDKNHMKQKVDQSRSERQFAKGDQVFLHLQPYKQTSLKVKHCHKLTPKFYGPYTNSQASGAHGLPDSSA
jgi:hypothetical protein